MHKMSLCFITNTIHASYQTLNIFQKGFNQLPTCAIILQFQYLCQTMQKNNTFLFPPYITVLKNKICKGRGLISLYYVTAIPPLRPHVKIP